MTELLKREVSLTVLKVRMLDANASSAPASVDATANQTLTPNQRIFCELQVTGNAEERGLVAPATPGKTNRAASRRRNTANRASYEALDVETPASLTRTLAQWSFATEEMQLPVHYSAAMRFQDKPSVMGAWLADMGRTAVTKLFSEIRADTLERFAAGLNWLPSGTPTLPSTMARQLQSLLPSVMREADSLWLELAEPAGYLPLLPWEEMLRPVTSAPILRLSPHSIMAHRPERALSVVLCLTVPSEKWTPTEEELARMARAIRDSLPAGSTLRVFPDDLCHAPFLAAKARVEKDGAGGSRIEVYDLPREGSDAASADEPWRVWIGRSLAQNAADIVHCVAPGMLFADQARLVIRREPISPGLDKRALRYVTPLELSESLTLLGAWAVVFSSPPRGTWAVQSRMGLRLFSDQIARQRPGVSALYDLEADPECKALTETYQFIIGDPSIRASASPAVSVYCHPARAARVAAQPTAIPPELMSQYLGIKETIQTAFGGRPLPVWLGATLRIAEQAVSRVAAGEMKGVDEATMRGIAAALKYVQQMVADQARARAASVGHVSPANAESAATANSPASGTTRELRLALVLYGGVSLAIYMHGVTKEIHKLLLASAAYERDPDTNPFPQSLSEHFYWSLLQRMHRGEVGKSGGVKVRVVVDVISGTSAGGINGICLAKAVARNRSQEALKTLWFERGDIKELAAAWKKLPLAVKGPWLVLKSAVTGTPPLRGDDMCRWLYNAFTDMDGAASSYPAPSTLLPQDHTLDLFVTTTDFQGYPRELPIYDPRIVTDVAHRHVLGFHHQSPKETHFGPESNHVLAFAARATSSFPGAFPPITFAEYRKAFKKDPNPPDLATLAAPQFTIYKVNDVDPGGSAFVDGGVLNNAPFALATQAIKGKPAAFEVVRRLLYIEPDPVPQGQKPDEPTPGTEKNAEVPAWLGTIWAGLSSIPTSQPVLDDLNNLAERNRVVRRIRDIIETSFDTIREHVTKAIIEAELDPRSMGDAVDGTKLLRVRANVVASAEREAGYALATYRRLRLRLVLKRFAAMIAGNLGYPPDTYPARYIETVASDWAADARLLNQVEKDTRVTENGPEQVKFLTEVDLDYEARRIQFVIAAFNWWYSKVGEAGFPTRAELDQAKELLYDYLAKIEALIPEIAKGTGRAALERAFPGDEVKAAARRQDRDYATRHRADLDELRRVVGEAVHEHVGKMEADLYAALVRLSAGWKAEVRFDLLVRYLGFPFWDILVFPVQALVDVNERDHVEVIRVSPYDATLLEPDGAMKLKGTGLHHFEAFFKREYRENDYLWGRLDAAERLAGLLLDDRNVPGGPADKRECWSIFDAIIKEERPALVTIVDTVKDLAARVEKLRPA